MADIPANRIEDLMLAQDTQLLIDDDLFTAMRDIDLDIVPPEQRQDYGRARDYRFAAADTLLTFTLAVTEGVIEYLRARGQKTNNQIPETKFSIKFTSVSGKSKTITLKGYVRDKRYRRPKNTQEDPTEVHIAARIINAQEPVAT